MANVKFKVPLDNFVQNGDTTLGELLAAIAAVNGGNNPGVVEQIRDPATGKLIRVELTLPDTAAAAATDAINANPGVPSPVVSIPSPLVLTDLDPTTGMVWGGAALTPAPGHILTCDFASDLSATLFVVEAGRIDSTGYIDLGSSLTSAGLIVALLNLDPVNDLVMNSGNLTLKNLGGTSIPIVLTNPVTLAKAGSGFQNLLLLWIAVDGKAYKCCEAVDGNLIKPATSFVDAVASGAL